MIGYLTADKNISDRGNDDVVEQRNLTGAEKGPASPILLCLQPMPGLRGKKRREHGSVQGLLVKRQEAILLGEKYCISV